jgi:excisionase family DNA binding protein
VAQEVLTAEELAKALKVSTAAVRRWTLDGIPCHRLGGRLVRFQFDTALKWLEEKTKGEAAGEVGAK